MKIAVCDGSSFDRELIIDLLTEYFENQFINPEVTSYASGKNLIYDIEDGLNYDILFLDIYLKDINGIETAEILREISFNGKILFLTANPDYVFLGYDVGAVDYLLKNKKIKLINDIIYKTIATETTTSSYEKLYKVIENILSISVSVNKNYFNINGNIAQLHKVIQKY